MQFSANSRRFRLFLVLILFALFFLQVKPLIADPNQELFIECIIIYDSGCPVCNDNYLTNIKPFYDTYRYDNKTNFEVIDIDKNYTFFLQEVDRLNIDFYGLGRLPWVIIRWGENQGIGFDYDNLESIEAEYLAIIQDLDYTPTSPTNEPFFSIGIIDPNLFLVSGFIGILELVIIGVGFKISQNYRRKNLILNPISNNRIVLISTLSIISIIALSYQSLDYMSGGCGCAASSLLRSLEFRRYEYIIFLGFDIPFSLIGFVLMNIILIQTLLIGTIKTPTEISLIRNHKIHLTDKRISYLHKFLSFQILLASLSLFYFLYIELFIVQFICLVCTISQFIIVVNTVLILTWKPKSNATNQIDLKKMG